jgi:hypothetical protein
VQAVGSIGAILVALGVVQLQHSHESKRQSDASRADRRGKLNVLLWLFNVTADTCNSIAEKVGKAHVVWHLHADVLKERRVTLTSFPLTSYPDQALLLRALDLTHRLQMAEAVVSALGTPRRESTQKHVADMLRTIRDEALVGVTEATNLLAKASTDVELQELWSLMDAREENRKLTLKVWAELSETRNESTTNADGA